MDHTDPARDPLRSLAEAALARQEAHNASGPTTRPPSTATRRPRPRRPTTWRPSPRPTAGRRGVRGRGRRAGPGSDLDGGRHRAGHRHHGRACAGLPPQPDRVDARSCGQQPARGSWWPTSEATGPPQHRKLGPSLGLLVRCGCGQQLGYAPFTSLAEAGQVLRRTDTCGSWNPWDTNYPHQGPMKETVT
jgi:hypothetical protein